MKDEALKLALEALESCDFVYTFGNGGYQQFDRPSVDKAITAIKQALAAPVQDTEAHYEGVVKGVRKLFDDKRAQPAVPDAFGTREGEHPQYIQGWTDCRAEMLRGLK
jgi:hypothetical protein